MILRADRNLEANTELLVRYNQPTDLQSYQDTQEGLRDWGFTCSCKLCLDKKSTPEKVLSRRQVLKRDFDAVLDNAVNDPSCLHIAYTLLEELDRMYSVKGVPHPELWSSYLLFSEILHKHGNHAEAILLTLKGLEYRGYIIAVSPPGEASRVPTFKIITYGEVCEFTANAFALLVFAYNKLAPQFVPVARQYAEIAYRICYGEGQTFGSDFDEFKY